MGKWAGGFGYTGLCVIELEANFQTSVEATVMFSQRKL
jgi:hypothetical protein